MVGVGEGKFIVADFVNADHFSGMDVLRIMKERQGAIPTWTGKL